MGNSGSSNYTHWQPSKSTEPFLFHDVHSENIRLSDGKRTAKRVQSFCKGVCFGHRPVEIGEMVCLQVVDVSTNWSGFLRVGFTAMDPATQIATLLPRYACPDMTNQPGNWAKALPERFGALNTIIVYSVNRNGEVHININGQLLPGVFMSGVNTAAALWPLVDIYGNATGVSFLDRGDSAAIASSPANPSLIGRQHSISRIPDSSPSKYHSSFLFDTVPLHLTTGRAVTLNRLRDVATRSSDEYSNAYVFISRPLRLAEKVVFQVLALDHAFRGGLTVGMTSCDPSELDALPDDSDQLLDRPEYWVVHKDVCTAAECGDELSFMVTSEGEVHYGKNGHHVAVIMHVDKSIPLWMFVDLYGQFSQMKLLGAVGVARVKKARSSRSSYRVASLSDSSSANLVVELPPPQLFEAPPVPPRLSQNSGMVVATAEISSANSSVSLSPSVGSPALTSEAKDNASNECLVCFDKACDSVLYTCGHMCMCYDCALSVKNNQDALCPICRKEIKDIIRIYRT